jgi:glutathione S-transferase
MIRILGRPSSINVRKVLWTCHEANIAVEHEPWGQDELRLDSADFLQLNPIGMVPVLVDGDFVLSESNAICRYLATIQQEHVLFPQAPRSRAVVEQWMDWQATELNNAWRYAFMGLVRKHAAYQDAQLIEAGIQGWNRHMTLLDAALAKSGPFIAGEQFTLADIVLGLSVHRWFSTPFAKPELHHVEGYYRRLGTRAGFRKFGNNGEP